MDSRRASLGVNLSVERLTGMAQVLSGSSAAEAVMRVPVCGKTIPGPAEFLSAGGCKVVHLWMPSREAMPSTVGWTLDPMVGVDLPLSLHLLRAERSVRGSDSGRPPDKHMHLEAGLTAVAFVRTRASLVVATPGHRHSAEGRMDEIHQEAVKASDPQGAFARRDPSCTEVKGVVALPLRAVEVVAVGEA